MLNEFRNFIARGNVIDLAVGIIIGAAFTAIVNSLVADLINPLIALVTGGIDFSNLFIQLPTFWDDAEPVKYRSIAAAREAGVPVFAYGSFITAVINFLIIAWVVFLLVKAVNKVSEATKRKEAAQAAVEEAVAGPTQEELLVQIRDLLAQKA